MVETLLSAAALGLVPWAVAFLMRWLATKWRHPFTRSGLTTIAILLALVGAPFILSAGYLFTFLIAGQPKPRVFTLASGVTYERIVRDAPRPIVYHVLAVDLSQGHRLVATAPVDTDNGPRCVARIPTDAMDLLHADVVVNGGFFTPFDEKTPLDYTPRAGELVRSIGTSIGNGRRHGTPARKWTTFWADPEGRVDFGDPPPNANVAVSGRQWLLREGRRMTESGGEAYPRTILGMDAARQKLWLVVVDGKQPRYSMGLTLDEVATVLQDLGAAEAIELDGGGSSTLAARDVDGRPTLLSRPCHAKVPNWQRPIATCLGIVFEPESRVLTGSTNR